MASLIFIVDPRPNAMQCTLLPLPPAATTTTNLRSNRSKAAGIAVIKRERNRTEVVHCATWRLWNSFFKCCDMKRRSTRSNRQYLWYNSSTTTTSSSSAFERNYLKRICKWTSWDIRHSILDSNFSGFWLLSVIWKSFWVAVVCSPSCVVLLRSDLTATGGGDDLR